MFRLTDELTGALLLETTNRHQATIQATKRSRDAALLLTGPGIERRRYAPQYRGAYTYRVPCGCGGWKHPKGEKCRGCALKGRTEEQIERLRELGRRRKGTSKAAGTWRTR